jgi:DNA-directed RNA polymerase specialized sigma24 family protein
MATDALLLSQARAFLCLRNDKGSADDVLVRAWRAFFQEEDARLRRFAHAFRVPADWKEDLVQDAWVEIVKKLRKTGFNSVEHFHCWMRKVVRVKVAYAFRCLAGRSNKSLDAIDVEPEDCRGKAPASQERAILVYDLFQNWLGDLQKQSTISYQLMIGRYVEEHGIKALVTETDLTATEIYSRLHRLRNKFREWALRRQGASMPMR